MGDDYHPGDEVLIADGVSDARATVVSVDDDARTVKVSAFDMPSEGWKLAYAGVLPQTENPNTPGLFPPGGTYLRKFFPAGRPAYYWGRLDHEWDLAHGRFGRRIVVNFTDAPGDLSVDGRNWTTAKDYAELHEVVRTISGHIIDRYGDAPLDFPWSVLNEPNLGPLFWRSDWNELQKFYDYSTDAILRAFEDQQLRVEAIAAVMRVNVPQAFPADAVEEVQQLSHMRPTRATRHAINAANHLKLEAQVGAGGVNVLIIEPTAKE